MKKMKRYLIIVFIAFMTLSLTGCKLFDLANWTAPKDDIFLELVSELDTPYKIAKYMQSFEWNLSVHTYSPYEMWLANLEGWNNTGDCDDYATFAMYVANINGYTTYRITMWTKTNLFYGLPLILPHVLCVYVEEGQYTYTSDDAYFPLYVDTFEEIIDHYEEYEPSIRSIISWKVYDYDMNIIVKIKK